MGMSLAGANPIAFAGIARHRARAEPGDVVGMVVDEPPCAICERLVGIEGQFKRLVGNVLGERRATNLRRC
jgi:hypothetical protein